MINFLKFSDFYKKIPLQDFHIHTNITDGKSTAEEYIESALQKKLEEIAFTEHVRKSSIWFDSFVSKVKKLRRECNLKIYYGIEAKAIDFEGQIDATPHMIEESEIVLGAVHRYPDEKGGFIDIKTLSGEEAAEIEFKLALGLLKYGEINVLAHPGGFFDSFFSNFPENYLRKLFNESVKRKIAIEFNSKYIKNIKSYFKLCKETNPFISLGSDAHNITELGNSVRLIRKTLKAGGK